MSIIPRIMSMMMGILVMMIRIMRGSRIIRVVSTVIKTTKIKKMIEIRIIRVAGKKLFTIKLVTVLPTSDN